MDTEADENAGQDLEPCNETQPFPWATAGAATESNETRIPAVLGPVRVLVFRRLWRASTAPFAMVVALLLGKLVAPRTERSEAEWGWLSWLTRAARA